MFDPPLVWCSLVKAWIAVDENESLCGKMQGCNVAACPKADIVAAVASAAREAPANACPASSEATTPQLGSDLRIF